MPIQATTPLSYRVVQSDEIDQSTLAACARLFSSAYGIWATNAPPPLRPGARVMMSASRLHSEILSAPEPVTNLLAICTHRDTNEIIGHAFATIWTTNGNAVCWITQLVVAASHRQQGIATALLGCLPGGIPCDIIGLASSHPAACLTLAKRAKVCIHDLDMNFIKGHAAKVLESAPVPYLHSAKLGGSLFDENAPSDQVSLANTRFFVDHAEPLAALQRWHDGCSNSLPWPLGKLPDGHEYLILAPFPP